MTGSKVFQKIGQYRCVEQLFPLGAETVTVVVVDDELPYFVVAFLASGILVEHVAQISIRFGMGKAQHIDKIGF